ncbi:MAG: hypothetical protein R2723_06940, partial [Microbacterium sp.]
RDPDEPSVLCGEGAIGVDGSTWGHGIADVFVIAIPLAVLAIIAIAFLKNKPLSTKTAAEQLRDQAEESAIGVAEAEVGASTATGAVRLQSADGAQWQTSTGSVAVLSDDELRGDEQRDEQLRRS